MHIIEITIDGFKSYSVRTIIGPFDKEFNAITGLNGSGKSNILDAICFVLGITQLGHMRAEKLQELVYKAGNSGVTKATVTIKFDNSNKSQSPPGYVDLPTISVCRSVEQGKSKYYINGKVETAEKVKMLFCSVKLNINNPHFLIMQGRVTKVINMKPKEVLGLIEEAAGISLYQTKKEQTLQLIQKKDNKLAEIERVLTEEVVPQFEKLEREKKDLGTFKNNESHLEENIRIITASDFYENDRFVSNSDIKFKQFEKEMKGFNDEKILKTQEQDQIRRKIRDVEAKTTGDTEKLKSFKDQIAQIENKMCEIEANERHSQQNQKRFVEFKKTVQSQVAKAEFDSHRFTREIEEQANELIPQTEKELEQKKEARRNIERQIKEIKEGKGNSQSQVEAINRELQQAKNKHEQLQNKENNFKSQIAKIDRNIKDTENQMRNKKESQANIDRDKHDINANIVKLTGERDQLVSMGGGDSITQKLMEDRAKLERDRRDIEQEFNAGNIQYARSQQDFRYNPPNQSFNKSLVLGKFMTLFRIKDIQKFHLAIENVAAGRLYNVVVRNEKVSKELIQNKSVPYNVTYIPLNVIDSRTIPNDIVQKLKHFTNNKVYLAKELIDFDPEVESAVNFVFGNWFVAEDEETAKKVAFANDYGKFNCVTIKGDKYSPQGTLEGGYKKDGGFLLSLSKYFDLNAKGMKIQEALKRIEGEMLEQNKLQTRITQLNIQIDGQKSRLNEIDSMFDVSGRSEQETLDQLKVNRLDLTQKSKEVSELISKSEKELESLKADLNSLKSASSGSNQQKMFDDKLVKVNKELAQLEARLKDLNTKKNQNELKIEQCQRDIKELTEKIQSEEKILLSEAQSADKNRVENAKLVKEKEALVGKLHEEEKMRQDANKDLEQLARKDQHMTDRIKELDAEIADKKDSLKRFQLAVQAAKTKIEELLAQNPWINNEREFFGVVGHKYHFEKINIGKLKQDVKQLQQDNEELKKRINRNVDAMFDKVETQYKELQKKKELTANNKQKFEDTIRELDDLKNQEIQKTWQKVDKFYSEIFSTLLPNAGAKLMPVDPNDISQGLELKVSFSGAWKDSLSELSGGQRSLLALSLILALLKYHPAPLYILDEIDSALDLSHTQNIGLMIKKYFQASQFVIVSLKEGLFQNANVLFKVQFVENRSTVKRYQIRAGGSKENGNEDQQMMMQH